MTAIVDKIKFVDSTNEKFSGYLNYVGRENATDRKKT